MRNLFILDDDTDHLFVLKVWFTQNQYKVSTFTHSTALFSAIKQVIPDMILLDVLISEVKNGTSVCSELKQQFRYPNKVYLFSATPVQRADLISCGADGFIAKPFELDNVLDIVNSAIV